MGAIPEVIPLFAAHNIMFYGAPHNSDTKNECVKCRGMVINIRDRCVQLVPNRLSSGVHQCAAQLHSLYTVSFNDLSRRLCPKHYARGRKANFCESISEALNEMCDQMNASYLQRTEHLKLQHINHFLGNLWKDYDTLVNDKYLCNMIWTNCSSKYAEKLYNRSRIDPRATIDKFSDHDGDPSSDYEPCDSDTSEDDFSDHSGNSTSDYESCDSDQSDSDYVSSSSDEDVDPLPLKYRARFCHSAMIISDDEDDEDNGI